MTARLEESQTSACNCTHGCDLLLKHKANRQKQNQQRENGSGGGGEVWVEAQTSKNFPSWHRTWLFQQEGVTAGGECCPPGGRQNLQAQVHMGGLSCLQPTCIKIPDSEKNKANQYKWCCIRRSIVNSHIPRGVSETQNAGSHPSTNPTPGWILWFLLNLSHSWEWHVRDPN